MQENTKTITQIPIQHVLLLFLFSLLSIESMAQHPDDPVKSDEHMAMLDLVPVNQGTHNAVTTGNWNDPLTWSTGTIPGNGARVVIPQGIAVIYNTTSTADLLWIRVDGKLQFATNQNTELTVETIVVTPTGEYQQGTHVDPLPKNFTSVITFSDNGALTDRLKIARGLLSHGKVTICGSQVTPFLKTNHALSVGATSATLASIPTDWKVGDKVAITGMRLGAGDSPQDEIKIITSILGSTITFNSGLQFKRKVDFAQWGLFPYIANTTRNIKYRSANTTDHSRKGHIMFMHSPNVDVRWAGFYDLGRTRKDIVVTDSKDAAEPTGNNPRGKYALHFHRTGHQTSGISPAYVQGCVVENTPGWGFVNHDSYVVFEDNVSYNAIGAHFVTENGGERGAFRRNIAMRAMGGSTQSIKEIANHDMAHTGHGFWFQGGNVIVEDNVASGCRDGGFTWFSRSTLGNIPNREVKTEFLLDPEITSGKGSIYAGELPIMSHKNNTAYSCYFGMIGIDVEINGEGPTNSVIENFTILNAQGIASILIEYYRNFTFKNCKILRDNDNLGEIWHGRYAIQAFNLIDHIYPLETRSADRAINLVVRNHQQAIHNFENANNDERGEAVAMSKWEVIGAPIDHNCPDGAFSGPQLVQNIVNEAAIIPFPSFSPVAGTYANTQAVTITSIPDARIYYVIGSTGWVQVPGEPAGIRATLEYQLKSGKWKKYNGPITINSTQKLIAVAVKDGQYSRIRNGYYTIDPNAPQSVVTPVFSPTPGTYTAAQNITISTTTPLAQIRYTTDGSAPSAATGTLINGSSGSVSIGNTTTLRAFAFKSGMVNSTTTTGEYIINTATIQNPVSGSPLNLPGIIETENFDTGGEGVAYHDADNANHGGIIRINEGVDIESCIEGGYNVAWIQNNEWTEYTVNVQTAGTYTIEARVAAVNSGGLFEIAFSNGNKTTADFTIVPTGGWQTWATVSRPITLNAGQQVMRINIKAGAFNINSMRVIKQVTPNPAYRYLRYTVLSTNGNFK